MGFQKEEIQNYLLYETSVDNLFIAEYAKAAPGDYVKVYLLALMYAQLGQPADNGVLAKALGLTTEDIADAWAYWEAQGIAARRTGSNPGEEDIVLLNIREQAFGGESVNRKKNPGMAAKLTDKRLSELLRGIESAAGRLLESGEPQTVAGWISDYGLDPDVILMAYKYCAANRKSSRCSYVKKVLFDWKDKGLSTAEAVTDYLSRNDRRYDFYKKVFRELGFNRAPSQPEKKLMDSWLDELECTADEVLAACAKTTGISSPNLNYINTILRASREEKAAQPGQENRSFRSVEEIYEQIRTRNERKTEALRARIYAEIPPLKELSEQIRKCNTDISRYMLMGSVGKQSIAEAKKKQEALIAEKTKLLAAAGYPAAALDPIYSCSKCKDTGLTEDGGNCSCYRDLMQQLLQEE